MPEFTAADGTRLAWSESGTGLPLLCLAGLTRDARDFDYLLPHLHGRRVIRPDYRGRGRSAHADPASYTVAQEAADQLALLDHLGIDKTAVLGTSRGGLIAMALALTSRGRLTGVCLNDVGPVLEPGGLARIEGYIGRRPVQKTLAALAAALPAQNPEFTDVPASRWREEAGRHAIQTPDGLALTYDPRLRDAVLPMLNAPPHPAAWSFFDAFSGLPLCLIRGAASALLSAQTAAEMCRRRPDMIFAEIPGRGHIPFLDEPGALAAIRAWLELTE